MRTSSWIAIGLALATTAWLASGYLTGNRQAEDTIETGASSPQAALVEVKTSTSQEIPVFLYAQGETRPFRSVNAVVQTSGSIGKVNVQQGDQVEAGAVLATIRPAALLSRREGAQAQVDRLEADLEGARSLTHQGVVPATRRRELEAQLAQARAELASIDEQIDNATIRAPVRGNVNEVFVNAGQFAGPGTAVAAIVDNAPLRVTFQIAQQDFGRLSTGSIVLADFATGHFAKGRVCFVARTADPETRTFRAEARIVNEDAAIPSHISAELRTETATVKAHFKDRVAVDS